MQLVVNSEAPLLAKKSKLALIPASSPKEKVLQDDNLRTHILLNCGISLCRLISKQANISAGRAAKRVSFHPETKLAVLSARVASVPNCECLILDHVAVVNDELVGRLQSLCPNLRYLSLRYCNNLSTLITEQKPGDAIINVHGCFPIISPHPTLTPMGVVELSMLSLQHHNVQDPYEGLKHAFKYTTAAMFHWMSNENHLGESPLRIRFNPKFQDLVFCRGFVIHTSWQPGRNSEQCLVLASLVQNEENIVVPPINAHKRRQKKFVWALSKRKGCWLVDTVYALQGPLNIASDRVLAQLMSFLGPGSPIFTLVPGTQEGIDIS